MPPPVLEACCQVAEEAEDKEESEPGGGLPDEEGWSITEEAGAFDFVPALLLSAVYFLVGISSGPSGLFKG